MKSKLPLCLGMLLITLFSVRAEAIVSPIGVSLFPPLEFPLPGGTVQGVRLGVYSLHESVYGLDIGSMFNATTKNFVGTQVAGFINSTRGHTTVIGAQLAAIGNWNFGTTSVYGVQASLVGNINNGNGKFVGLGLSAFGNSSHGTVIGAQIGAFNQAEDVYGFQVGLYNVAKSLHGIQIGLININKAGPLKFFPLFNIGL